MQLDSEFAGLLVAFGFLLMGLVSMPIATWVFLGALILGCAVALLLRFGRKEKRMSSAMFSPNKR